MQRMNEIVAPSEHDVTFTSAMVTFNEFEYYKQQCQKVADHIDSIVLTEDNVKEVKKNLAAARKITDGLNSRRIEIKKVILEDYTKFEGQVKELQNIIRESEDKLRAKVREMEESERNQKKKDIRDIWDKRWQMCSLSQYLDSETVMDKWLQPQHLNKSTSIKAVEKDMTEWMASKDKDLETLESMDDEDYLVDYLVNLNLQETITAINYRKGIKAQIHDTSEDESEEEESAAFIITGTKNIKLTELLLEQNDIAYIRR